MADEPKIEPPVPNQPPRSVGFLISQLGFFSSKRFAEALEPIGIAPREFLLLRFVAASAGQSQQALAERLGVPASRMVALVDDLEERGLIERQPDPDDRRVRGLHLTKKGREALERSAQVAIEYEMRLCSSLAEGERDKLIDLLQKVQEGQTELRGVRGLHLTKTGRETLERSARVAIEYEMRLCSSLAEGERDKLIDLLQKVQEGQTELRGVHPGLSQEHPARTPR